MKIATIITLGLISTAILAGCSTQASVKVSYQLTAPYITDTDHQRDDDTALEQKIQKLIDERVPGNKIKPFVYNYDVLLVGQVATPQDKATIVNIVKSLPSPDKVFNYIEVAPKPKLKTNSSITDQAKTRLETQNNINGQLMKVVTVDGNVYLMGSNLGDLTALDTAIDGIYSIPGIKKVINLVQPGEHDYYSSPIPLPED